MVRSDETPTRRYRPRLGRVAAVVTVALLGSSLFMRSTAVVDPATAIAGVLVLSGLAIGLEWRRSATDDPSSAGESEDEDRSNVWDAIPSWQYGGRHVESGGITRGEQERALQDIQRQAEELSDEPPEN
ncbi:hypothetical protein [Natrinema versiforme]|uniref:Uncharacterized protein n=1 Tax=Natrinema versiforme JCM 10478 TaxID=1227496 RepID=L9XYM4_9EURY|nr:hypothetical protein [Natrinema versiforme]ELY65703.1 hypothetical protein C489_14075 [Natrinema versiforme JCM 10478]